MFCGILVICFLVFPYSYILDHSCIFGGFRYQAWYLKVLCSWDVGGMHYFRWSVVWEDRIGVIFVMVNSCRDGFGIVSITLYYDIKYVIIRFDIFLDKSVVVRVCRGGVFFVIYFHNGSGIMILHGVV